MISYGMTPTACSKALLICSYLQFHQCDILRLESMSFSATSILPHSRSACTKCSNVASAPRSFFHFSRAFMQVSSTDKLRLSIASSWIISPTSSGSIKCLKRVSHFVTNCDTSRKSPGSHLSQFIISGSELSELFNDAKDEGVAKDLCFLRLVGAGGVREVLCLLLSTGIGLVFERLLIPGPNC